MKLRQFVMFCFALGVTSTAFAETLGDVLDSGGKKLTRDDVVAQLVDSWIRWTSPNGMMNFQVKPNADGTLQVSVTTTRGFSAPGNGKWTFTGDGRYCMSFKYSGGALNGDLDRCAFWFKAGENYWASGSDSDRSTGVFKYSVSK